MICSWFVLQFCRVTVDNPLVCCVLHSFPLYVLITRLTSVATRNRLMKSDAQQLGGIAATHHRLFFFLFFPENWKGLGLQSNAPGMLDYLGLKWIYFRAGKGGPWGHLKWLEWRVMNLPRETLSA